MSKKSKKKKSKKSPSSSHEDEKSSKERDATRHHKSSKRKHDATRQESSSHARKEECRVSPKDCSQGSRRIKKPIYRLSKTQTTDQKPVYKEEESTKPKSKDVSGSKTASSKPSDEGVSRRKERTFKGSSAENSSQSGPSVCKKQKVDISLASYVELKRRHRHEEPQQTRHESRELENLKKRREHFKKMCHRHQGSKTRMSPKSTSTSTSAKQNTSASSSTPAKSSPAHTTTQTVRFKIPKLVKPKLEDTNNNTSSPTTKLKPECSDSGSSKRNSKVETVQRTRLTPSSPPEVVDKRSSPSDQRPTTSHAEPWYDQMQVAEELHVARCERKLDLDVMQSYGELTCMDIDPPDEGAGDQHCKQTPQQDLILVLDTNILLSHLDYVKKIVSHGLGASGCPVVLIPWVVLQELDSLKRGRGMSGSVAHLATPAISYIYNSLTNRVPRLWGQSMQQAAESSKSLNAENNDDRVLQCCLQYQSLYPECAHILCTNDKNLCSKALLSGVTAFSKTDLESEIRSFRPQTNIKTPALTPVSPRVSPTQSTSCWTPGQEGPGLSGAEKHTQRLRDEEETTLNQVSVSELEDCLRDVLSDVLEVEMRNAYEDLWLEIVYVKPPWSLQDVLHCLKKHWIAVFGHVVPRRKLQNVLHLIDFFNSGESADRSRILAALQEAKDLVRVFGKSSSRVPNAISMMDNIYNKLQPQWEPPGCDVVMNDNDEDRDAPAPAPVSHQDVWTVFETIWSSVYQISLQVFKALGFDPHTMQSTRPAGTPPQDAVVCLHKVSSMVSQLLQAFSSILSSSAGLDEVQSLLAVILSHKIVEMDSRLTAKDFVDCFSQQDYREKLRVGGAQLMELKEALDRCVGTMNAPS